MNADAGAPTTGRMVLAAWASSLLMVLALLGIWNEVRFQGCVARADQALLINATAHRGVTSPPACHRLPFRH